MGETATVTFTPSEALAGLALSGVTLQHTEVSQPATAATSLAGLTRVANSNNYTATLTGLAPGQTSLVVRAGAFSDRADNPSVVDSNTIRVVVTNPQVGLEQASRSNSGSRFDQVTNVNEPRFTVNGLAGSGSLTVTAAKQNSTDMVSYTEAAASGTSQTVHFSGPACDTDDDDVTDDDPCRLDEGIWSLTASYTPSGATQANVSAAVDVTIDNTAPSVTEVLPAAVFLQINRTTTVTLTTTEPVTGLVAGSFDSDNQSAVTVDSLTGSGSSYTLTLRAGTVADEVKVSLPAAAFIDTAGNPSEATAADLITVTTSLTAPPSPTPTVTLQATSDSGDKEDPLGAEFYTMIRNPVFEVSLPSPPSGPAGIQASSTVTVTATLAATATTDGVALTRTLSDLAAGDITSGKVVVPFTVAGNCTAVTTPADGSAEVTETGHSCSLSDDGEWSVTASYTQTGDYSESAASAAISVWVDNVGPTVTITPSVSPVPAEGTSTVTFMAVGSGAVSGFSFGSVSHSGSGGELVSLSAVPQRPGCLHSHLHGWQYGGKHLYDFGARRRLCRPCRQSELV